MKSGALKAIVIGAGWAGEGHTKALQHLGVEVTAICGRKAEVAQKVASQLGVSEASTDWRQTLLRTKPDIVSLATPAILRTEVVELAAELGCHLLCDKPLATTAEEAHHLYTIVQQAGIKHAYAATHVYGPAIAYINQILTSQAIGELMEIEVVYSRWSTNRWTTKTVKPWAWVDSLSHGGGILNNGLTHLLSILERMTERKLIAAVGEARVERTKAPVSPTAIHDLRHWLNTEMTEEEAANLEWRDCDAESAFSALFRIGHSPSETGIPVLMRPYPAMPIGVPPNRWYICCEQAAIVGRGFDTLSLSIAKNPESQPEPLPIPQELVDRLPQVGDDLQNKWGALVRELVADIEGHPHEPYLTFHDGWRYQVAIDAIRRSDGWVQIPE